MTIHDLVARGDIEEGEEPDAVVKPSLWGLIAVVLLTLGFWAGIFALAGIVF
jgi:hypothetical protein